MPRVLGNGINDGPRDPNNPKRVYSAPVTDTNDPQFLIQMQPEIDFMKKLLELIRKSR